MSGQRGVLPPAVWEPGKGAACHILTGIVLLAGTTRLPIERWGVWV